MTMENSGAASLSSKSQGSIDFNGERLTYTHIHSWQSDCIFAWSIESDGENNRERLSRVNISNDKTFVEPYSDENKSVSAYRCAVEERCFVRKTDTFEWFEWHELHCSGHEFHSFFYC